jgi:hypothetical protein
MVRWRVLGSVGRVERDCFSAVHERTVNLDTLIPVSSSQFMLDKIRIYLPARALFLQERASS